MYSPTTAATYPLAREVLAQGQRQQEQQQEHQGQLAEPSLYLPDSFFWTAAAMRARETFEYILNCISAFVIALGNIIYLFFKGMVGKVNEV